MNDNLTSRITDLEMKLYDLENANLNDNLQIQSLSIDLLMKAFCKAQANYEPLKKSGKGERGPYSILEDYERAAFPALRENNLGFYFYRTPYKEKMLLRARLQHDSGQFFESVTFIPHKDNPTGKEAGEIQGICTRLERYLCRELLGIMGGEEEDAPANKPTYTSKPTPNKITDKQLYRLKELIGGHLEKEVEAGILRVTKRTSLSDLSVSEASDFIGQLTPTTPK